MDRIIKPLKVVTACVGLFGLSLVHAHSGGATMDPAGNNPHFMAVADVSCVDDGNGPPDHIFIRIKDNGEADSGTVLNLLVYKANKAISTSDPIPGDADFGPGVELHGGGGRYTLMVSTTGAGARNFIAEWHCETADNVHTGTTEIVVRQFN